MSSTLAMRVWKFLKGVIFQPVTLINSIKQLVLGVASEKFHKETAVVKAVWMFLERVTQGDTHERPLGDARARDSVRDEEQLVITGKKACN